MPPKSTDPRKAYSSTSGIDGFKAGSGRYIGAEGKRYQQFTGAYDVHVTMDSSPKPYIDQFHISVYFYPRWTRGNPDLTGKTKPALWNWRWNVTSSSYAVTPDASNRAISPAALAVVQKLAQKMQFACFTTGSGTIAVPAGATLPATTTATAAKSSPSSSTSSSPSLSPSSSSSSSRSSPPPTRQANAGGWKTVSGPAGPQEIRDRRQQRKNKTAAFAAAIPPDSALGKWLHAPRTDGTRDEQGRGSWHEQSAENAAREALLQHEDFDGAERQLGRAIDLRRRPPEGTEEDDDRPKPISTLVALRSAVKSAKAKYLNALRGS